jgi:hypothetical protein
MGLSRDQAEYAGKYKALGLRARYYGTILTKFTETFAAQITDGNRELAAAGFPAKAAADLSAPALKRKAMLDYIAAMGAKVAEMKRDAKPHLKAEAFHRELSTRVGKLENIPSSWL